MVSVSSLPSRERGLKSQFIETVITKHAVAPLAGAWIEIHIRLYALLVINVAPLAGAWIEISIMPYIPCLSVVAPLAGAWIEIEKDK